MDTKKLQELRKNAVRSAYEFNAEMNAIKNAERRHFWDIQTSVSSMFLLETVVLFSFFRKRPQIRFPDKNCLKERFLHHIFSLALRKVYFKTVFLYFHNLVNFVLLSFLDYTVWSKSVEENA